ncbi:MAG: hypothetical protein GC162_03280 [Planctomycetes bacterium]|nr:hypothetical protein [Planctomycetota bacterium]
MSRSLLSIKCLACVVVFAAVAAGQIQRIAASDDTITITLAGPADRDVQLLAAPVTDAAAGQVIWAGRLGAAPITTPRRAAPETPDRLFMRFTLIDAAAAQPIGAPHFVTDLSSLSRHQTPFIESTSIKGLQCIVDIDDAAALGVQHAAVNVDLGSLYDHSGRSDTMVPIDGQSVPINMAAVARLDAQVARMTQFNMRVTLILLNYLPRQADPNNPTIHPRTDPAAAPNRIGAFNTVTPRGAAVFRGVVGFLADRYTQPDRAHGLIDGFIIGNEVQSHWQWCNMGLVEPDDFIADYARTLRLVDLAARSVHPDLRVYISLDHNWTRMNDPDAPQRCMSGRYFVDHLRDRIAGEGDFPWAIAFHPYPEDLTNPRTWNDRSAALRFDTPRITFRNIEVLPAYFRQPRMLYDGQPRRIILSEQGLNCLDAPDGEKLQAAGFAYAWYRISRTPGIDAFIYHRHADYVGEGVRLGLRENVPGTVSAPGKARLIYDVFRAADTPRWCAAFDFALPIIGIDDWSKIDPVPFDRIAP